MLELSCENATVGTNGLREDFIMVLSERTIVRQCLMVPEHRGEEGDYKKKFGRRENLINVLGTQGCIIWCKRIRFQSSN